MECDSFVENGLINTQRIDRGSRVGLQFGAIGRCSLRLDVPAGLPGAPTVDAHRVAVVLAHPHDYSCTPLNHDPFMSTMDEISYWIYTKRAPCLMNYDNEIKKQSEAQSSQAKPKSVHSVAEVPSPKKKKKRKLSLFDDNSTSTEKQQHVYFDSSQNKKQAVRGSCKSDSMGSNIDFNIKIPSVQTKSKKYKLQRNSKATVNKKNKLVTSTPKVSQLRRSLRQAQQSLNNNSQLNSSFEIYNPSVINGHTPKNGLVHQTSLDKSKKTPELLAVEDQSPDNKNSIPNATINKTKNDVLNGQFEDLSDVSGLTANYIRSTKLHLTKTSRKLRCKNSRNLVKNLQHNVQKDNAMVVCVNKSVSTAHKSAIQNCSTDSENVINFVTTRSNDKATKVSKSTSLLKFMDSTMGKETSTNIISVPSTKTRKATLNVSFQSKSSTSRYPKRFRNCSNTPEEESQNKINQEENRKKISKSQCQFNNSDRKENPEALVVSKTRSGRNIGLTLRQPENSVLVLSNSTEHVSSMVSMNVASPIGQPKERKKKRITRHLRSTKVAPGGLQKDSLRDKSGFTACFSDSDEDSEQLKQRKFFCA